MILTEMAISPKKMFVLFFRTFRLSILWTRNPCLKENSRVKVVES